MTPNDKRMALEEFEKFFKNYPATQECRRFSANSYQSIVQSLTSTEGQWRTIDSAPRDGTKILLYPTHGHYSKGNAPRATIGYWWEPSNPKYKGKWTAWDKITNPTHWLPLPSPPIIPTEEVND